jgi:SH3-like domain-containing protein
MSRTLPSRLALLFAGFLPLAAVAEYRTVESATVLYDTPSLKGVKRYVVRRDTPLEVILTLGEMAKVRDSEGSITWIEKGALSNRRTVIVKAERASVFKKPEEGASLSFEADHNVSLAYVETVPGGWIKVRHSDGQEGFVRAGQVWGF